MTEKIIIAGSGGQGIMLLGKILATAAMQENKHVTWLPSYGAEVRGGTSHCMVIISDAPIGSPYISKADTLIMMNRPSLEKFKQRIKDKGLLILNSSLADEELNCRAEILKYPFSDIAIKLGNIRVANVVALGCYLAKKKIVGLKTAQRVIAQMAPADKKHLIEINQAALSSGRRLSL